MVGLFKLVDAATVSVLTDMPKVCTRALDCELGKWVFIPAQSYCAGRSTFEIERSVRRRNIMLFRIYDHWLKVPIR